MKLYIWKSKPKVIPKNRLLEYDQNDTKNVFSTMGPQISLSCHLKVLWFQLTLYDVLGVNNNVGEFDRDRVYINRSLFIMATL